MFPICSQFWNQTTTENKLGAWRVLGADFDKNKYQPIASLVQKVWQQGQGNQ